MNNNADLCFDGDATINVKGAPQKSNETFGGHLSGWISIKIRMAEKTVSENI